MTRKAEQNARHALLDRVLPALRGAGEVRARAMFGGWGIYLDGVIVGIIARCRLRRHESRASYSPIGEYEHRLFFRTDDSNRADFQSAGTAPFTYQGRGGKSVAMPYWEVPGAVLDEPERLCAWALKARAASVAVRKPGKAPRRRRPSRPARRP